jgi:hypothetical protein
MQLEAQVPDHALTSRGAAWLHPFLAKRASPVIIK